MKILLAYSSKTKNTKKVAEAIYEQIKDQGEVDLLDIKLTPIKICNVLSINRKYMVKMSLYF